MSESNDCTPLTRGSFIGAAGAVGLAVSAGPLAGQAAGKRGLGARRRSVDLVVVGAGISGLAAARAVRAAGRSVLVLEANDRVGGPTLNEELPHSKGQVVEAGGQWAGPAQTEVLALAKALGVKTFKTYDRGQTVLFYDGSRSLYTGAVPAIDTAGLIDFAAAQSKIEALGKTIHSTLRRTRPTPRRSTRRRSQAGSPRTRTPARQGALQPARERNDGRRPGPGLAAVGGVVHRLQPRDQPDARHGWRRARVPIRGWFAAALDQDRRQLDPAVILKSPVTKIDHSGSRVDVSAAASRYRAKAAIVAIHPADTARIEFRPTLPVARAH